MLEWLDWGHAIIWVLGFPMMHMLMKVHDIVKQQESRAIVYLIIIALWPLMSFVILFWSALFAPKQEKKR